ncbi:MAG: polysulfide reductase NrfD [Armatimonadetes bacterium]|nr:polysulfide reductase NrfD [Armatimonadota bacterium]
MPVDQKFDQRLLTGDHTNESIDATLGNIVLDPKSHKRPWMVMVGIGFLFVNIMLISITVLVFTGIGIWGNNQPVGWGFDIINFVWWIGIGHAGTLISAILLLMRQRWRNSINRFAEAMTIFAVMCAGIYPLLHTGRPWVAYWLLPYPNIMGLWPQFRSPLIWDVFAISTYFLVSVMFWYVGLVPDLGTLRDRSKKRISQLVYGVLSLGWRGSARHWHRYMHASIILAGLSAPLVLSVHSIISFDFAMSIVPGWNVTIFPPYFVAGAVYAGFAVVIALLVPLRRWYGLQEFVTMKHMDWMARVMLATGLIVVYGYAMEWFYAWYSGEPVELSLIYNKMHLFDAPYSWIYYLLLLCNFVIPQMLWFPKIRQNLRALFWISIVISIGMWFERFVIIPMSLTRDYLPSAFGYYSPTIWDFAMFFGTIGFFIFMIFLFVRFLPMINIFEMKEMVHTEKHEDDSGQESEEARKN